MRELTQKDAILNLQTYLRAQSLVDENAPNVPIDGIFDSQTRYALTEFQRKNGLAPTGVADRTTWELLYAQYLDILDETSLPAPVIPFPSYPSDYKIRLGDKNFLVATVQFMLNEIGVIYNVIDTLEIDGVYGVKTAEIIRNFQERGGLPVTGEVDRRTWAHLARIYNISMHYIEQY